MIVTPAQIEQRLVQLSKEVDAAHGELVDAESKYHTFKADYEIAVARARLKATRGQEIKLTVQEREDIATIQCEDELRALAIAEALVKAARGNSNRVRTQVDIARSVGTSVRTSMDV
jgi:hypothetical protein